MDPETIQKAIEAVQRVMKPILETINRVWKAFKDWVSKNPVFIKLLRREMAKRNRIESRALYQPLPTVKAYCSQVRFRPVPRLARSRC